MTRAGWLVVALTVLMVAGVVAVAEARSHRSVDTSKHSTAAAARAGIDLKTTLSLRQKGSGLEVVATITIQNNGDLPVLYAGLPCYQPATPAFESTLRAPAGPLYPASAAVLRDHVMQYRRSFDQGSYFVAETAGHVSDMDPCDESAPPTLPPHRKIVYTESQIIGTAAQPDIDAFSTDVVTTLQLGSLPDTWSGRIPPPIQVVDTIQVRTHLRTITDLDRPSMADYVETSRRFDLLMQDPRVATWVDAQDPSLWRSARLMPTYRAPQTASPTWKLEAFHRAWAVPLVVQGTDGAITSVSIPAEPASHPPAADAVLPADSLSSEQLELPSRDLYVGDLVLPSGKVMVGDTVSSDNMLQFDYGLLPGKYEIHIVTAKVRYRTQDYEDVAWEVLVLSSSPVTHWQPAVPVGHSMQELKAGELFSFGTDGAGAGFASPEAMKVMDANLVSTNLDDSMYMTLSAREEANDWLWAMATVDGSSGANVFATSTGGDGGFPVLVGLDAQNRPAELLSDFGTLRMTYSGIKI